MVIKSSITFGGATGLDLDRGEAHVAFFDQQGKPAVFSVFDDFRDSSHKTVMLVSRRPVKVVLKDRLQRNHRFSLDMCLTDFDVVAMPLWSEEGVAYIELGGIKHAVVPFVNLPWLAKKINLG